MVLGNFSVYHPDSARCCGQSHRRCFCEILRKTGITGPQRERKEKDTIDHLIAKTKKKTCLFCTEPLLVKKTRRLSAGPMPHHRTDGRTCWCLRKLQLEKFAWINKGWIRRITLARRGNFPFRKRAMPFSQHLENSQQIFLCYIKEKAKCVRYRLVSNLGPLFPNIPLIPVHYQVHLPNIRKI